ncbi:MAG: lipase family protein [Burkholderiales bacterium]|nr:lipase family protein [Burkholderiales bacterium]
MSDFDRKFARQLLEICRYTYARGFDDAINAADKADALNYIKNVGGMLSDEPILLCGENSDTSFACVATYPDKNIVAYMGTKTQFNTPSNAIASVEDWSRNVETPLTPFKLSSAQLGEGYPATTDPDNLGGLVHEGFLKELCAVQAQVVNTLLQHGGRAKPVYVTGHSQGGAEAVLATRALIAGGFDVVATYTFAAPRAGNLAFVQTLPAGLPLHRIEFGDDIVPHVPPAAIRPEMMAIVQSLKSFPLLSEQAQSLLKYVERVNLTGHSFASAGALCYGSNKTQAMRVDISADQEAALFYDRLWSLIRHPERWAEHHHLAGTSSDTQAGVKGNYTALVSTFAQVN